MLSGYPNATALLEASRLGRVDIDAGCLTVSPERLGRYRFSLPFQEAGLLRSLLNLQLLRPIGLYLLLMAILSWLVWPDQKGVEAGRGHAMVVLCCAVLCWVVRTVAASLIVSTITLDLLEQSGLPGFHPSSLQDLAGRRVAARAGRAGSISPQHYADPLIGRAVGSFRALALTGARPGAADRPGDQPGQARRSAALTARWETR